MAERHLARHERRPVRERRPDLMIPSFGVGWDDLTPDQQRASGLLSESEEPVGVRDWAGDCA
jgi:hypothetical protein